MPAMKTMTVDEYLAKVAHQKTQLGLNDSPQPVAVLRSKGLRRTARKIALLRFARKKALASEVESSLLPL